MIKLYHNYRVVLNRKVYKLIICTNNIMVESQTQVKPQFIMLDKEAGVFRPAETRMPAGYIGHELERNVELGEGDISPDSLNLVSSVYLGPINIYEEQLGNIVPRDALERLREHKHGIVSGIVSLAKNAAQEHGVQYFGLNVVQTEKDRTWKFTARDPLLDLDREIIKRYGSLRNKEDTKCLDLKNSPYYHIEGSNKLFDELRKPLEFVLHPTAQLYVPRR